MEARDAFRTADAIEARYKRLQTTLSSIGRVNVTVNQQGSRGGIDQAMRAAQADIRRMQAQRAADDRKLQDLLRKQTEQTTRQNIASYRRETEARLRELRRQQAEASRSSSARLGLAASGGFGGVGGALTAGAAVLGIGTFVAGLQSAIDIAVEASRANRILASSATEAGLAFADAAEKNKRFAEQVGLSEKQAAQTTGAILRLAGRSGRPEEADRLLTGFADLGAAFGIDSRDLQTLIGTILSGQDEGLNRLGIADPGALQREYAKEIGKSVDQLTQMEKIQAAVNAVMAKSAIFTGAAADRMNSLEGSAAKTAAAWDKFTTSLATTAVSSPILTEGLKTLNQVLESLSLNLDEVNKKLGEGKSPAEIAKELSPGPGFTEGLQAGATSVFTLGLGPLGLLGEAAQDASNPFKVYERNLQELTRQIEGQQALTAKQAEAAEQQTVALAAQKKIEEEKAALLEKQTQLAKNYQEIISDPKTSVSALRDLKENLDASLGDKKLAEVSENIDKAITKNIEKATEQAKELTEKFSDVFTKTLTAANSTNAFVSVIFDAKKAMEELRKETQGLPEDLQKAILAMQQGQNSLRLFNTQLDTQLSAFDLRQEAARFRGTGYQPVAAESDADYRRRVDAGAERAIRLGYFGQQAQNRPEELTENDRNRIYRSELITGVRQLGGLTDFNFQTAAIGAGRFAQQRAAEDRTAEQRLQAQLDIIDSLAATSPAERAAADRKIIELSSGLDPNSLTAEQRDRVASVREREAERLLASEKEAMDIARRSLEVQEEIRNNGQRLLEIAEAQGTAGIQAQIEIKNSSGEPFEVTRNRAPNGRDTRDFYGPLDFVGGTNR